MQQPFHRRGSVYIVCTSPLRGRQVVPGTWQWRLGKGGAKVTGAFGAVTVTVCGCSHAPRLSCKNDCGHSLSLASLFADPGSKGRHMGSFGRKHSPCVELSLPGEPSRSVKRGGTGSSEGAQAGVWWSSRGAQGCSFIDHSCSRACRTNRPRSRRGSGKRGSQPHCVTKRPWQLWGIKRLQLGGQPRQFLVSKAPPPLSPSPERGGAISGASPWDAFGRAIRPVLHSEPPCACALALRGLLDESGLLYYACLRLRYTDTGELNDENARSQGV